MNYIKIYNRLICNAKNESRQKGSEVYYENHHILPRCLEGTDEKDNLVLLTAREHFIAHWLLIKIHPDNFKLIYALNSFALSNQGRRGGRSHLYKYARELYIRALKHNDEWKRKMAKSLSELIWIKNEKTEECLRIHKNSLDDFLSIGYTIGRFLKQRRPHTKETKEKISKSHIGKRSTETQKCLLKQIGKNKIWVCNETENKHIQKEEIDTYLCNGWRRGRLKNKDSFGKLQNRIQITKESHYKYVTLEEIEQFFNDGWKRGSPLSGHQQTEFQRKIVSNRTSGTLWINDGVIQKRIKKEQIKDFPCEIWKIGRIKRK